jgi:hypothetical protein
MGKDGHHDFVLCGTCHELYEDAPQPGFATPQRCKCRRTDEPKWPRYDFNEHLHLCECCRLVGLRSGSRWSVWFCEECKTRVMNLNRLAGRCLIPIGRHSLMAGVGLDGSELARADDSRLEELISRFTDRSQSLFEAMDHLSALDATRDVPLDAWLGRLRPLADAEPHEFGKEGSFEALVRWFASD